MKTESKSLIIVADMEGASGIFTRNAVWCLNGGEDWRKFGRACITSDLLAVCNAAKDNGIGEVFLVDMHFAGNPEYNVIREELPPFVRVAETEERCLFWGEILEQAPTNAIGLITVGQHARFGTADAYFPHTIQSPPIKAFYCNDLHIAEIGMSAFAFGNLPLLANVGCAASMAEAREINPQVTEIIVKNKKTGYEPSPEDTYPIIYNGITKALTDSNHPCRNTAADLFRFRLELCDGYVFGNGESADEWQDAAFVHGVDRFWELKIEVLG
jgi:D-aminopeptidase